jgi:hypothetical protein
MGGQRKIQTSPQKQNPSLPKDNKNHPSNKQNL